MVDTFQVGYLMLVIFALGLVFFIYFSQIRSVNKKK